MTTDANSAMPPDQSRRYGEQYHDVYQHFFPPSTGDEIAAALLAIAQPTCGGEPPVIAELGVGNGRVAIPLALAGADVLGVDSSQEFLAAARSAANDRMCDSVRFELGDLRVWRGDASADLACCVCATVSMMATADEQQAVLRAAASAVRDGGAVVVETHDPSFVRAMHGDQAERVFAMPVDGLEDVTAKSALYDDAMWRVEFEWSDGPRRRSALEFSRLTEPDELERLAAHAGLVPADRWAAWTSHTSPSGRTPTYISTFLRPAAGSAVES